MSVNLTGPLPIKYSAAFSDDHVSWLNNVGNVTMTHQASVAGGFPIVEARRRISGPP